MSKKELESGSRHPCIENGAEVGEVGRRGMGRKDEGQNYCLSHIS